MVAAIATMVLAYHGIVLLAIWPYHLVHVLPSYVRTYTCTYSSTMVRTTTETVLREAMQALWRVQAHMLARIVVEIRAADIAVELEP
jgi:hypothetical protein